MCYFTPSSCWALTSPALENLRAFVAAGVRRRQRKGEKKVTAEETKWKKGMVMEQDQNCTDRKPEGTASRALKAVPAAPSGIGEGRSSSCCGWLWWSKMYMEMGCGREQKASQLWSVRGQWTPGWRWWRRTSSVTTVVGHYAAVWKCRAFASGLQWISAIHSLSSKGEGKHIVLGLSWAACPYWIVRTGCSGLTRELSCHSIIQWLNLAWIQNFQKPIFFQCPFQHCRFTSSV